MAGVVEHRGDEGSALSHPQPEARSAELVLVTGAGELLGRLPPVVAGSRWWSEVESVVAAVREQHGFDVVVLRLLGAERAQPHGGRVTYLAEVAAADAGVARARCTPASVALDDHPLRNAHARPGGPARDLEWALALLESHELAPSSPPLQVRTWNLSSLWRIPLVGEQVWLKVVPEFFRHEGALIRVMPVGARVPRLIGHDGTRLLMRGIAGEDLYEADVAQRAAMIDLLIGLQRHFVPHADALLALGLPDFRGPALAGAIAAAFERVRGELSPAALRVLPGFVTGLHERHAALDACGMPDSLVHGDFHSGNVRGTGGVLTLLDWGDAGVGHPLLDSAAFLARTPEVDRPALQAHWALSWRQALPGSDPERAFALIAPIAAARQAVVYQRFLDNIEPSEHPYHRADPAAAFEQAAALL